DGLAPGVYHYDPLGHRLEPLGEDRRAVDELLSCAGVAAAMDRPPPVLISMTVRFRRLSWKYEGLAYRMVLMHVGVLIQSLYLVCTAMRLAPCALGSVSIEAAARVFGTDWRVEPCVGQFIVGGALTDPALTSANGATSTTRIGLIWPARTGNSRRRRSRSSPGPAVRWTTGSRHSSPRPPPTTGSSCSTTQAPARRP